MLRAIELPLRSYRFPRPAAVEAKTQLRGTGLSMIEKRPANIRSDFQLFQAFRKRLYKGCERFLFAAQVPGLCVQHLISVVRMESVVCEGFRQNPRGTENRGQREDVVVGLDADFGGNRHDSAQQTSADGHAAGSQESAACSKQQGAG